MQAQLGVVSRLHVKAYLIDAAGRIVGVPVHTVHPLDGAAVIEERSECDGLRMVYEITASVQAPVHI